MSFFKKNDREAELRGHVGSGGHITQSAGLPFASSTNYMTVIVGPATGTHNGLPQRNVVSIYPGC